MSVRKSLAWTYLAQAISFFATFGSTVVVARLLTPRDFGVYAMVIALSASINVIFNLQLTKFVMRENEPSIDLLRALFTANLIISLSYYFILFVSALVCLIYLSFPEVGQFLLVFSFFPLIAMLEFIPSAICARENRFGEIASMSVIRAVVLAGVTIALAYAGFAYMSFAWGQIAAWIASTIGFNFVVWRPDIWRVRRERLREIFRFGGQMVGIGGLAQLNTRVGEMALGLLLGLTRLGLYSRAAGLPATVAINIFGVGSTVIFSRMSQEMREGGTLHFTYLRFMRLVLGLLWPMMLGLAVLAQPVIHILYGAKWEAAALPLSLLTIAAAINVAIGLAPEIFILRHQTGRQVRLEGVRAGAGFVMFVAAALVSLPLAALAKVAEAILGFLLYRRSLNDLVGGPRGDLRRLYLESVFLSIAAAGPALGLMLWHRWSPLVPIWQLGGAIALGGLLWLGLLVARGHPIAVEVQAALRSRRRVPT